MDPIYKPILLALWTDESECVSTRTPHHLSCVDAKPESHWMNPQNPLGESPPFVLGVCRSQFPHPPRSPFEVTLRWREEVAHSRQQTESEESRSRICGNPFLLLVDLHDRPTCTLRKAFHTSLSSHCRFVA